MSLPRKVILSLSYDETIKFWYRFDRFNQLLNVRLITKVGSNLKEWYMQDCISEAYDHYNAINKNEQIIFPGSIDGSHE